MTFRAQCADCQQKFEDRDESTAHMKHTYDPAVNTSHTITILDPGPECRARRLVEAEIELALQEAFEQIDRQITRGEITEDAATEYIRGAVIDFENEWTNWREDYR